MSIAMKSLNILPAERAALMLGFAFLLCVLASYYLVRPLRDAASGWLSAGLTAVGAGFGLVALAILPVAGVWAGLCFWLARRQEQRAASIQVEEQYHEPH
jgi:hypothetical protein